MRVHYPIQRRRRRRHEDQRGHRRHPHRRRHPVPAALPPVAPEQQFGGQPLVLVPVPLLRVLLLVVLWGVEALAGQPHVVAQAAVLWLWLCFHRVVDVRYRNEGQSLSFVMMSIRWRRYKHTPILTHAPVAIKPTAAAGLQVMAHVAARGAGEAAADVGQGVGGIQLAAGAADVVGLFVVVCLFVWVGVVW